MESLVTGALIFMGMLAIVAFGFFLIANHFVTNGGKRKSSLLSITVSVLISAFLIYFLNMYFLYH
jgi:hypothetical protein